MTVSKLSIRKKLALQLFRKYKKNESKIHQLNYLFWECTSRCNLNCLHCGSDCRKDALLPDLPAQDFLKAIDQVREIVDPHNTMIVFTGGEALLRPDLEEIGTALYNKGFPWGIVTNGMLLNEKRLHSLSASGLRAVTVSLDGLEGSHNWLRNHKTSYQNAIHAIQQITTVRDLKFDVVTCVNRRNFSELGQLREVLIQLGVKEWRIFTIFPIGRAKENEEFQLEPIEFNHLFEFIKQTRKENRIQLNYGCEGYLGNYESEVRDDFFFCRAGVNIASILADGSISACPNLRANFIQGNIYEDNFAAVWQNNYTLFRDRSWTRTGVCAECKSYDFCEGNGMHLRDEKTGALLFCHLNRLEEAEA